MALRRIAPTATATVRQTYTFENLEPDLQGFFMVRAVNSAITYVDAYSTATHTGATALSNMNQRERGTGAWAHFAEPAVDTGIQYARQTGVVHGTGALGTPITYKSGVTSATTVGTPRHYRAPFLDILYPPVATLTFGATATSTSIAASSLSQTTLDALLGAGQDGNTIATIRGQLGALTGADAASAAMTYNSRWYTTLREGAKARLNVTISGGAAGDAYVLAYDALSNTTKAIGATGFVGPADGLDARGMVGTGTVAGWAVNTGLFNTSNYAFFATKPGTYKVTFSLDVVGAGPLVTREVEVTVGAALPTPLPAPTVTTTANTRIATISNVAGASSYNLYVYNTRADAEADAGLVNPTRWIARADGVSGAVTVREQQFTGSGTRTLPAGYERGGRGISNQLEALREAGFSTNLVPGVYFFGVQAITTDPDFTNSPVAIQAAAQQPLIINMGPDEARDFINARVSQVGTTLRIVDVRNNPNESATEGYLRYTTDAFAGGLSTRGMHDALLSHVPAAQRDPANYDAARDRTLASEVTVMIY